MLCARARVGGLLFFKKFTSVASPSSQCRQCQGCTDQVENRKMAAGGWKQELDGAFADGM